MKAVADEIWERHANGWVINGCIAWRHLLSDGRAVNSSRFDKWMNDEEL